MPGHRMAVHADPVVAQPVDEPRPVHELRRLEERDLRDRGGERNLDAHHRQQFAGPRTAGDHDPFRAQRSPVGGHRRVVRSDLDRDAPLGHRELGARCRRVGRQRPHRVVGEHRARVGVEQATFIGLDSELREATAEVGRVELVERRIAGAHRGRQRVELRVRSQVDLSGLEQERDVLRRLQAMPSLERRPGESHVALVVVREPDGARRAGRRRHRMADPPPVDAHDAVPAMRERSGRGEPGDAEADHDHIGMFGRHRVTRVRSADPFPRPPAIGGAQSTRS